MVVGGRSQDDGSEVIVHGGSKTHDSHGNMHLHQDPEPLVDRLKGLDAGAWEELYEEYYPLLYRYIHARVFDSHSAEDLAASVFVAAVESIKSYRDVGKPLLAWFYGISSKVVADHQRKLLRRKVLSLWSAEPDLDTLAHTGHAGDPATLTDGIDLRRAVAGLPKDQREVMTLRYFVGTSPKEIALLSGKSISAVYSLEARALVNLRRAFPELDNAVPSAIPHDSGSQ